MVYVVPSLRERVIKLQMNERGNLSERRSTMYIEFQKSVYTRKTFLSGITVRLR